MLQCLGKPAGPPRVAPRSSRTTLFFLPYYTKPSSVVPLHSTNGGTSIKRVARWKDKGPAKREDERVKRRKEKGVRDEQWTLNRVSWKQLGESRWRLKKERLGGYDSWSLQAFSINSILLIYLTKTPRGCKVTCDVSSLHSVIDIVIQFSSVRMRCERCLKESEQLYNTMRGSQDM